VQNVEFSLDNSDARYSGYYKRASKTILHDCFPWKPAILFLYREGI